MWWFNHLNDHQLLTKWEALQCVTILFFWLMSHLLCFCCFAFNCVLIRLFHILQYIIFVQRNMTALLIWTPFALMKPLCGTKTYQPTATTMENWWWSLLWRTTHESFLVLTTKEIKEKTLQLWDQPWTSKKVKCVSFDVSSMNSPHDCSIHVLQFNACSVIANLNEIKSPILQDELQLVLIQED